MMHVVTFGKLTATLYLGDGREIAPTLEGVGAVISDPPYGMKWNTDSTRFTGRTSSTFRGKRGKGRNDHGEIEGDKEEFDPRAWVEYPRCVLMGSNHFAARLPVGTTLVWLKRDDHLFQTFPSDAEIGWMKGGHGVYVYRKQFPPPLRMVENDGRNVAHPTQKPVGLMIWLMKMAKVPEGETVLDPYMGSGTTGIACLRTGRNFIGIEQDEKHFATALDRITREARQGVLL